MPNFPQGSRWFDRTAAAAAADAAAADFVSGVGGVFARGTPARGGDHTGTLEAEEQEDDEEDEEKEAMQTHTQRGGAVCFLFYHV